MAVSTAARQTTAARPAARPVRRLGPARLDRLHLTKGREAWEEVTHLLTVWQVSSCLQSA
eukprot:6205891-Pleurochrysis_carterae.AAC.4